MFATCLFAGKPRLPALLRRAALGVAAALTLSLPAAAATITQNMQFTPQWASGWTQATVGSIDFAQGTNAVQALTARMFVRDQGWGGHDYWSNDLRIGLIRNGTNVWSTRIAGAGRAGLNPMWQSYDILDNQTALNGLNTALSAVDWSVTTDLQLRAYTDGLGWPGWAIGVYWGQLSVTSSSAPHPVPLPAGALMLVSGLALLRGASRQRPTATATR